jgi:hypothetical protein
VVVASSANGNLLPFQVVHKGGGERVLPKTRAGAEELGMKFVWNKSNHWSSFGTMLQYLEDIITPYLNERGVDSKCVLLFDCWSVHKSAEFRAKISKNERIFFVFVPAGTTSKLQPADVMLQRILKHIVRTEFAKDMANDVAQFIREKGSVKGFKFDNKIGKLRDRIPKYLVKAFNHFQSEEGKQTIINGWRRCRVSDGVSELNLLSAFEPQTQDFALDRLGVLFPNGVREANFVNSLDPGAGIDEPTMTEVNDANEVSLRTLADELLNPVNDTTEIESDESLYCICNGPASESMIACDSKSCPTRENWYHFACVGIEEIGEDDEWLCPSCTRPEPVVPAFPSIDEDPEALTNPDDAPFEPSQNSEAMTVAPESEAPISNPVNS